MLAEQLLVEIIADTSQLRRELATAIADVESLQTALHALQAEGGRIPVQLDAKLALETLRNLTRELDDLERRAARPIEPQVNTADALHALQQLEQQALATARAVASISQAVTIDVSQAITALAQLTQAALAAAAAIAAANAAAGAAQRPPSGPTAAAQAAASPSSPFGPLLPPKVPSPATHAASTPAEAAIKLESYLANRRG